MKEFFSWLEEHAHEYLRIVFIWMFAAILSPWRIPMLLALFVFNMTLLMLYERMNKNE